MKVLLELLDDAANVLDNLDDTGDLRPSTRRRVHELLERLTDHSERLLGEIDVPDPETRDESTDVGPARESGGNGEARADRESTRRSELLQKGLAALARDRFQQAHRAFEEAVSEFPEDVELLNHLALTCWERGDFREAAGWYGQAMEAGLAGLESNGGNRCEAPSSEYGRAIEGRALCLYQMGNHDEAVELFETLAELAPSDYGNCLYLAGEIRHLQGNPEAARQAYRASSAEPSVLYNLGLAEWQLGHHEAAVATWIRGFVANPHIAAKLIDTTVPELNGSGYVGSRGYADEYLKACDELWREADGARSFLASCWEHPSVTRYVTETRERQASSEPMAGLVAAAEVEADEQDRDLRELARQVLDRPEG